MSNPLLDDLARNQDSSSLILALPTLGRFYPEGVLAPNADPTSMEVYPLGIASEIHLNDPLLLASGKAIPKLIRSVCPAVEDADRLCGIDVDAIMMASRIASHGEMLRMEVDCQQKDCDHRDTIDVNLQDIILRYAPMDDEHLATMMVPIPELDQVVCVQPPTYQTGLEIIRNTIVIQKELSHMDEVVFEEFIQNEEMVDTYMEMAERNTVMSISSLIDCIFFVQTSTGQRVTDKEAITEWAMRVKREYLFGLRDKIRTMTEDIDKIAHVDYQCSKCGKTSSVRLTLDPQKLFFSEPEGSGTTKKSAPTSKKKGSTRRKPSRTSQR